MSVILSELEGGVRTLTFNRPERKNALTLDMYEKLAAELGTAAEDPEVRVVVLRGAGGNFTSGNDLQDFMVRPPKGQDSAVFRFLMALVRFPKPLIGAVEGVAVGVGTTMLLHCDLVYAAEDAVFSMPFLKLALVPEGGSSLILPLMIGQRRAAELLLFGDKFDALTAQEAGIVNSAMPADQLYDHVAERAGTLAAMPPVAVRESKRLLKAPIQDQLEAVMADEGRVFIERLQSPELAAAITAFFKSKSGKKA